MKYMFVRRTGLIQQGGYIGKEQEFLYKEIYLLAHASAKFMTTLSVSFIRILLFRPRLNIPIFLPI